MLYPDSVDRARHGRTMKGACRAVGRFAGVCGAAALLLAGCGPLAASGDPAASVDAAVQALQQFLGDFARQAVAAFLF